MENSWSYQKFPISKNLKVVFLTKHWTLEYIFNIKRNEKWEDDKNLIIKYWVELKRLKMKKYYNFKKCVMWNWYIFSSVTFSAFFHSLILFFAFSLHHLEIQIHTYVKGHHAYKEKWTPEIGESHDAQIETNNPVVKYTVCIEKFGKTVGHLNKGEDDKFAKALFFFLRGDNYLKAKSITSGRRCHHGDGESLPIPFFHFHFILFWKIIQKLIIQKLSMCIYIYIYIYIYTHSHTNTHMHADAYICVHTVYAYACVHIYITIYKFILQYQERTGLAED